MRKYAEVHDVGVAIAAPAQIALHAMHVRWRGGRRLSTWQQSRVTDAICRRAIDQATRVRQYDAVLEINDLAIVDTPFFVYQDMSYDALLWIQETTGLPLFRGLGPGGLRRRQDRQRKVYERATGVLAMSHWLARNLVEISGVPAEKVHVVHAGTSAAATGSDPIPRREAPRRRLLVIGRDFHRKGGDLVVAALATLRKEVDPAITLTIAGPARWPLPDEVPPGVTFLGERGLAEVGALYDNHDLFVLPSRLEPFGIVFAEAIARGVPCVARDAFAMPEVVRPGITGSLVSGDDPGVLAEAIATALADDALYFRCAEQAAEVAARFSWDRAGRDAVAAIAHALNG